MVTRRDGNEQAIASKLLRAGTTRREKTGRGGPALQTRRPPSPRNPFVTCAPQDHSPRTRRTRPRPERAPEPICDLGAWAAERRPCVATPRAGKLSRSACQDHDVSGISCSPRGRVVSLTAPHTPAHLPVGLIPNRGNEVRIKRVTPTQRYCETCPADHRGPKTRDRDRSPRTRRPLGARQHLQRNRTRPGQRSCNGADIAGTVRHIDRAANTLVVTAACYESAPVLEVLA